MSKENKVITYPLNKQDVEEIIKNFFSFDVIYISKEDAQIYDVEPSQSGDHHYYCNSELEHCFPVDRAWLVDCGKYGMFYAELPDDADFDSGFSYGLICHSYILELNKNMVKGFYGIKSFKKFAQSYKPKEE